MIQFTRGHYKEEDEEEAFGQISEKAFSFWNDPADDVYEEFYKKKEGLLF